jgi:hypothetical protein
LKVPSGFWRNILSGCSGSIDEVTTSCSPSPSKSSTIEPPAREKELRPSFGAMSYMRGSGYSDASDSRVMRHCAGTPSGQVPSVMWATFRSHIDATSPPSAFSISIRTWIARRLPTRSSLSAAVLIVVAEAVLPLAETHPAHRHRAGDRARGVHVLRGRRHRQDHLELLLRRLDLADAEERVAERLVQREDQRRRRVLPQRRDALRVFGDRAVPEERSEARAQLHREVVEDERLGLVVGRLRQRHRRVRHAAGTAAAAAIHHGGSGCDGRGGRFAGLLLRDAGAGSDEDERQRKEPEGPGT